MRRIPFAVAFAGAALLVYWTATKRPLWVDEEMLLLNARDRGFLELAGPLWLDQSVPLAWLATERAILLTLGTSEPAVRLLPVIFGIATLMTAAWIGRRWMSPGAAAVFVGLCAIGEWPVFFTLELKHYSADMCGALLIQALAAWTLDGSSEPTELRRRLAAWWMVASSMQWFSNGALFVTPLTVVVLCLWLARRRTAGVLATMLIGGLVWLASFAANYALVLRHAVANTYLQNYWAFAFPPVAEGVRPTLAWIARDVAPFARKPGSSELPLVFWSAWIAGVASAIATRRTRTHGAMIATVPISLLGLALFHVVPPFERLAIWAVPSIYAGIAYAVDAGFTLISSRTRARPLAIAAGISAIVIALAVSIDVARLGINALAYRPRSNYGLDDRSSIRTLLAAHRPGDAVLTTHFGLAGLWWYGKIPISDIGRSGRLADGSPIFQVSYESAEHGCSEWHRQMDTALTDRSRAAVYLGFRMNVEPVGFDGLVLRELARRGTLEMYKPYAEASRVAIFDLRASSNDAPILPADDRSSPPLDGCVAIRPAARW